MYQRLLTALEKSGRTIGSTPAGATGHDVLFSGDDAYLVRAVVDFLAEGARAGQPLIVFATASHRRAFEDELRSRGLDTDEVFSGREAVWLDARDTLAAFMVGACPDRELFMATTGSVFEKVLRRRDSLIVRGYAEMVDLLWQDGNAEGAMILEGLWNDLAGRYAYSLLCGYSMDNFLHATGDEGVRRICGHHTHARPVGPPPAEAPASPG